MANQDNKYVIKTNHYFVGGDKGQQGLQEHLNHQESNLDLFIESNKVGIIGNESSYNNTDANFN